MRRWLIIAVPAVLVLVGWGGTFLRPSTTSRMAAVESPAKSRAAAMADRERAFREDLKLSGACVEVAVEATKASVKRTHGNGGKAHVETWGFVCDGVKQRIALTENDCVWKWSLPPAPRPAGKAMAAKPPAPAPPVVAVAPPPPPPAPVPPPAAPPVSNMNIVTVIVPPAPLAATVASPQPTPPPAAPAVSAPPAEVQQHPGPGAVHTWRPNLWSWKHSLPEGRKILDQLQEGVSGKQSIDLGSQIREAAAAGKIVRYSAACQTFSFEWLGIDSAAYIQDTIWVTVKDEEAAKKGQDAAKEVRLKPKSASQGLYGCDGQATLSVPLKPGWAKEDMAYAVTAPQGLPLRFPKGRKLYSCGKPTADVCNASPPTPSYRQTQRASVTSLHFVVND